MNELQVFTHPQFGPVRTIIVDGQEEFCASDVAKSLNYKRPNDAIAAHCRYTAKHRIPHPQNPEKTIEMNFIPEGDVHRLITHSEMPEAERYESWLFDEVCPAIRKHGAYMTPATLEKALLNPDFIIDLATRLKDEQEKRRALEGKVEQDKPKVLFAAAVEASHTSILIGELAKLLRQNGIEIGQNRLFAWMRDNGYLIKRRGTDYNMPTQYSMERGLLEIKESTAIRSEGSIAVNKTTKVTGKGQTYFVNLFLGMEGTCDYPRNA